MLHNKRKEEEIERILCIQVYVLGREKSSYYAKIFISFLEVCGWTLKWNWINSKCFKLWIYASSMLQPTWVFLCYVVVIVLIRETEYF